MRPGATDDRGSTPTMGYIIGHDVLGVGASDAASYDDPQGLRKYLYAHCDPINQADPSGRSPGMSLTTLRIIVLFAILITVAVVSTLVSKFHGVKPSISENQQISAAIQDLKNSAPQFNQYTSLLDHTAFRIVPDNGIYLARTAPVIALGNIIWITEGAVNMENKRWLEAILLHESVHLEKGQLNHWEKPAHQVESDFLNFVHAGGKLQDLAVIRGYSSADRLDIFMTQDNFKRYHIHNPAIY